MKKNPILLVAVADFSASEMTLPLNLEPETLLAVVGQGQLDLLLLTPLTGELKLTRNEDYLRVRGEFAVGAEMECYRCLAPFTGPVAAQVNELLKLDGRPPTEDEEADGFLEIIDGQVNLAGFLNEIFWLAWPHRYLCQPHCAGLCCGCGADLNCGPCDCLDKK